jgi:uroporphyrinogen decarboxylase
MASGGGVEVNGRERVLLALDGGEPDRVPRALGFSRVDESKLVPQGWRLEGSDGDESIGCSTSAVDVHFVDFPPSPEDDELRRVARPFAPDTRLGTAAQAMNYARWRYHPEEPGRRNPLARARSLAELQAFRFPDVTAPYHVDGLARQVRDLHRYGLAAGGSLPHLGGELFESAWRLRGLENFLLDLVERPDWARFLLDRLTDMARRNAETLARAGIDVLSLGDDVGMPTTMMISPAAWRAFFKPRLAAIIQSVRTIKRDLRVLFHSDGYIEPILGDLVEIGVQAIHPVQPEHMDAVRIRRRFGARLALWGTVGHQNTFRWATPDEIRQEVKQRVETLGRAGLVLCPAYDLEESDVYRRNVAAFLEAAAAFGRKPVR